MKTSGNLSALFAGWSWFYKKYFYIETDLTGLSIPNAREGFTRVIIIANQLSLVAILKALRAQFEVDCFADNLDQEIIHNFRNPANGDYAVCVRGEQEPIKDFRIRDQVIDIERQPECFVTLFEHLIFTLKHFVEAQEHLDIEKATICPGSKMVDHNAPVVRWKEKKLVISYCSPRYTGSNLPEHLGSRLVITV